MQFFIRRYVKGAKSSGTSDVFVADNPISTEEFHHIARISGSGKYILCVRGKGIRGFKKLDEYILAEEPLAFDAETIAVQHNLQLDQLSSEELLGLMGNMINNPPHEAEGQEKFMSDLKSFHAELSHRGGVTPSIPHTHEAEGQPLVSAGFPIGTSVVSFVLGAVTGGLAVWYIQKNEMLELKSQISGLEATVQKAEEAIQSVRKKAEEIEKNNNSNVKKALSADEIFMSQYNSMMGGYQP